MAYQNINFPALKLLHGIIVERQRPTTVISNFSKEYRISRYSTTKSILTFPSRNLTVTDWNVIRIFLESMGWERDSFNFIVPGTSTTIKVRLQGIPTTTNVAFDSNNIATMVNVSEIRLVQVFNE